MSTFPFLAFPEGKLIGSDVVFLLLIPKLSGEHTSVRKKGFFKAVVDWYINYTLMHLGQHYKYTEIWGSNYGIFS